LIIAGNHQHQDRNDEHDHDQPAAAGNQHKLAARHAGNHIIALTGLALPGFQPIQNLARPFVVWIEMQDILQADALFLVGFHNRCQPEPGLFIAFVQFRHLLEAVSRSGSVTRPRRLDPLAQQLPNILIFTQNSVPFQPSPNPKRRINSGRKSRF